MEKFNHIDNSFNDIKDFIDKRLDTTEIREINRSIEEFNINKRLDVSNNKEYPSSLEERKNCACLTNGKWEGDIGNSLCIANHQEIINSQKEFGIRGINYKNGIPDFSPISIAEVKIPDMSEIRHRNFSQADSLLAAQWNKDMKDGKSDWIKKDIKEYRHNNHYSWHECNDMKTCQLVKTDIHLEYKHLGGVSECKKYYGGLEGEFDE
jgi:NAD+--asparagine ADP-ribosyltransferase